jgi:hypothetical protein
MLPNFSGEFFLYNLVSDKLEGFEKGTRKVRNTILGKITIFFFGLAQSCFKLSKPYIHTELLKKLRENIANIQKDIKDEFDLRNKMAGGTGT